MVVKAVRHPSRNVQDPAGDRIIEVFENYMYGREMYLQGKRQCMLTGPEKFQALGYGTLHIQINQYFNHWLTLFLVCKSF